MQKIQWSDLPEARQLASLGKKVSRPAQGRLQWMLFYYFNGRNAARTCRRFGISRQTFYRWKRRFDRHDLTTLERRSHRPRQLRKPTWSAELVERVLALRKQYPRWAKTSWWCFCEKNSATFLLRWSGASWCNSNGAGRCTSHRNPPWSGRHDGNCGIVYGLFASLNTGESNSPETWWR